MSLILENEDIFFIIYFLALKQNIEILSLVNALLINMLSKNNLI
jgi:hypothetical protein